MNRRTTLIGARLFFALLTLAAIVAQLVVNIQRGFDVVNYFSYFTNLSNILAAVVMLIGAIYLIQHREPALMDDFIRGSSVAGMAVVGIAFNLLLREEELGSLMPWVNTVTHYIMPIAVVLDWLYQSPKSTLALSQIPYWLIFPLLYLAYTLIRGAMVDWYPYSFFNPANVGGYGGVLLYSVGITVLFVLISWILITLGNRIRRNVA